MAGSDDIEQVERRMPASLVEFRFKALESRMRTVETKVEELPTKIADEQERRAAGGNVLFDKVVKLGTFAVAAGAFAASLWGRH